MAPHLSMCVWRGWQVRVKCTVGGSEEHFMRRNHLCDGTEVRVREQTWPSVGSCKLFSIWQHEVRAVAPWEMRLERWTGLQDYEQNDDTIRFETQKY